MSPTLTLDPTQKLSPLIPSHTHYHSTPSALPEAKVHHTHHSAPLPSAQVQPGAANTATDKASLYFVGTATTVLEWGGIRIMTDPNFLHAGDHVHLGPGVTATRVTNPAVDLENLPAVHAVLLSHFHEDHFDKHVQENLRKDLPIISTSHAVESLQALGFKSLYGLDTWQDLKIDIKGPSSSSLSPTIKVTSTPGEHVAGSIVSPLNDLLGAVPPTSGWMVELDRGLGGRGYRIYISGDTLMVDKLREIPNRYPNVDLLLIHLGGTTIPGPNLPILMVTMDAKQGCQLVKLIKPKLTLPIHYDDYDVFLSPLSDFKKEMLGSSQSLGKGEEEGGEAGGKEGGEEVIWWERGERFDFGVQ